MKSVKLYLLLTMCFTLALQSMPGYCAGISLGNGASFHVGNATIDLNCLDLETAGQFVLGAGLVTGVNLVSIESTGELNGDAGSLWFSGDWWNAGTFTPAQSDINVRDGCGATESMLLGSNDFFDFSASTLNGKTLSIEAGSVQAFAHNLSLMGVDQDQRLKIRSSVNGQAAYFELSAPGVQQIYAVDVKDNDATGGQLLVAGNPSEFASVDSGNNKNWFEQLIDLIFRDGFESD
jgi:hypothetical protein